MNKEIEVNYMHEYIVTLFILDILKNNYNINVSEPIEPMNIAHQILNNANSEMLKDIDLLTRNISESIPNISDNLLRQVIEIYTQNKNSDLCMRISKALYTNNKEELEKLVNFIKEDFNKREDNSPKYPELGDLYKGKRKI